MARAMGIVGHAFHSAHDFAISWFPLLLLCLLCYLLWRTVQMMPRVKPPAMRPDTRTNVSWSDVAGAEEAKAEQAVIEGDRGV